MSSSTPRCRKSRESRHLDAPLCRLNRTVVSSSPGPSKIRRKPSDLDCPQAPERPLRHPPPPGPSINSRKPSDLDGKEEVRGARMPKKSIAKEKRNKKERRKEGIRLEAQGQGEVQAAVGGVVAAEVFAGYLLVVVVEEFRVIAAEVEGQDEVQTEMVA